MPKQRRTSNTQRRIAARILKCGESRIWMDPSSAARIKRAITRNDVRGLISDGLIKKQKAKKNVRRASRRQDVGSRKGASGARTGKKKKWLKAVRPQRKLLIELKPKLKPLAYRKLYRLVKGGSFRSKAHLQIYLKEKNMLEEKK